MNRKDCNNQANRDTRVTGNATLRRVRAGFLNTLAWPIAVVVASCGGEVQAGSVRLWPSAIVVEDVVRMGDVCEFRGFSEASERKLVQIVVADAPPAGGSRSISVDDIRAFLSGSGANMATITLRGATNCEIARPSRIVEETLSATKPALHSPAADSAVPTDSHVEAPGGSLGEATSKHSLKHAVMEHFNSELARYGGRADLTFDRTSEQVLNLSGPMYDFRVRRRGGKPIGLTPLEIDVVVQGRTVQTVPLVVNVTMTRRVAVVRRTINLGATIRAGDIEMMTLTFHRLESLGVDDSALVIGQRAKRVIPSGGMIETSMLEQVPLVLRGQLVTLISVSGAIRVVTTAKAAQEGLLGAVIKVRAVDNKRVEFDATVTGPAEVRLGAATTSVGAIQLAHGGGS